MFSNHRHRKVKFGKVGLSSEAISWLGLKFAGAMRVPVMLWRSCCGLIVSRPMVSALTLLTVVGVVGCGQDAKNDGAKPDAKTSSLARPGSGNDQRAIPGDLAAVSPNQNQTNGPIANPALAQPVSDLTELLRADANNPLVGSWLGGANMNETVLIDKLAKLVPEEQAELRSKAENFKTYQVAMDFFSDGRLGMVVQFAIDGKVQSAEATGTWKVIQQDPDSLVVELVEQMVGGPSNTSQVRIGISPDGQQIARPAELDPRLSMCDPMFILSRVSDEFLQQTEIATLPEVQQPLK